MISMILSWVMDLVLNGGWVAGLVGGAGGVVGLFTKGWLRWALLAAAGVGFAFWIMSLHLTIAHQETTIVRLEGEAKVLTAAKKQAVEANERLAAQIHEITEDRDTQAARAAAAGKALAQSRTAIQSNTAAIMKEVDHAATPLDDAPVPDGMRAALRGLRERYARPDHAD